MSEMKTAIVTGVTGQDGSYLAELLLEKGYRVVGLKRRTSTNTQSRIDHIDSPNFLVDEYEISDSGSVYSIVEKYKPDEIYNLAAQSHVGTSFDQPDYTFQVNTIGVINLLEAIRRFSPSTKFYQASTSEMFGKNVDNKDVVLPLGSKQGITGNFQDENTAFEPQSPYAAAKLASHHLVRNYREGYSIFGSCGILFNHESERRGENFVTRKITKWIGDFIYWLSSNGLDLKTSEFDMTGDYISATGCRFPKLRLGNIDAYRDWGHAEDYVYAMWLMLQQENPDDFVVATGEACSVRNFLSEAFEYADIGNYEDFIVIDPKFYRPSEVEFLRGDPYKAEEMLGWSRRVTFKDLVHRMVESDIHDAQEKKKSEKRCESKNL
jgi:GDPmannose 4,6-dehydratase|tara:strand:- start:9084 stop:10220 length:1137 start_codon:yes stop_codon:yes gene_type:complete